VATLNGSVSDDGLPPGSVLTPLDGSTSADPDGDPVTFTWSFLSLPAGSSATLTGPSTATPTFLIDRPGSYDCSRTM